MKLLPALLTALMVLCSPAAFASPVSMGGTLPPLSIDDRGEIQLKGDDFEYTPWASTALAGAVQVVQYFGATMGDSKKFEAFTDRIEEAVGEGGVQVTTIINMDAALWGTGGMVKSELKKNKQAHPEAIIVLDEEGVGVEAWGLGKEGSALIILDEQGKIVLLKQDKLSDEETEQSLEVLKQTLGG